jgi:hypothetical protein
MRRSFTLPALLLIASFAAAPAFGSTIIGRDVSHPTLTVDTLGRAHVTYRADGRTQALTAWGAINARAPSQSVPQVKFRIRYGQRGKGVCLAYDGPSLARLIKACRAPDGSYWALQSWVRLKPNYGGTSGAWELHLSHWRGPLAVLAVYQNWAGGGKYRHIFGRLTYKGRGVYGFKATNGDPLDGYGRNVYLDTFDSAYGKGWHRENSFLSHHRGHTLGDFCYGFFPHGSHAAGEGSKYRATVEGPGVTPDVMWSADDIGRYDASVQAAQRRIELGYRDPKCRT